METENTDNAQERGVEQHNVKEQAQANLEDTGEINEKEFEEMEDMIWDEIYLSENLDHILDYENRGIGRKKIAKLNSELENAVSSSKTPIQSSSPIPGYKKYEAEGEGEGEGEGEQENRESPSKSKEGHDIDNSINNNENGKKAEGEYQLREEPTEIMSDTQNDGDGSDEVLGRETELEGKAMKTGAHEVGEQSVTQNIVRKLFEKKNLVESPKKMLENQDSEIFAFEQRELEREMEMKKGKSFDYSTGKGYIETKTRIKLLEEMVGLKGIEMAGNNAEVVENREETVREEVDEGEDPVVLEMKRKLERDNEIFEAILKRAKNNSRGTPTEFKTPFKKSVNGKGNEKTTPKSAVTPTNTVGIGGFSTASGNRIGNVEGGSKTTPSTETIERINKLFNLTTPQKPVKSTQNVKEIFSTSQKTQTVARTETPAQSVKDQEQQQKQQQQIQQQSAQVRVSNSKPTRHSFGGKFNTPFKVPFKTPTSAPNVPTHSSNDSGGQPTKAGIKRTNGLFNTPFANKTTGFKRPLFKYPIKTPTMTRVDPPQLEKVSSIKKTELKKTTLRELLEYCNNIEGGTTIECTADARTMTFEGATAYRFDGCFGIKEAEQDLINKFEKDGRVKGLGNKKEFERWVELQWQQTVYYLASMARFFSPLQRHFWTVEAAREQMRKRYVREFEEGKRPMIRRIMEGDSSAKLASVYVLVHRVSQNTVLLSDGYYPIAARVDAVLIRALDRGRLKMGTKMVVIGATLLGSSFGDGLGVESRGDGISPFQLDSPTSPISPCLSMSSNSVRTARWDTKLGFVRTNVNSTKLSYGVHTIKPDGGPAYGMATRVVVVRKYPVRFMENTASGSRITRTETEELRVQAKYLQTRTNYYQKLLSDYNQSLLNTLSNKTSMLSLTESEELYLNHISSSGQIMNSGPRQLLESFIESKRTEFLGQVDEKYPARKVTPYIQLLISSAYSTKKTQKKKRIVLSVWNCVDESIYSVITEGLVYNIIGIITPSHHPNATNTRFLRLNCNSKSIMFMPVGSVLESHFDPSVFTPRNLLTIDQLTSACIRSDIDVVGLLEHKAFGNYNYSSKFTSSTNKSNYTDRATGSVSSTNDSASEESGDGVPCIILTLAIIPPTTGFAGNDGAVSYAHRQRLVVYLPVNTFGTGFDKSLVCNSSIISCFDIFLYGIQPQYTNGSKTYCGLFRDYSDLSIK
ncbi:Breast cancer type 2 susceptibility protein [Zancudomyces culisetae]|uniref:Breast cancer type 2 susceptibility protein n=1 Tax=Zancudomyces culisetae TaxID=1213189 RepID=A0A1R1PT62_ZANCU|nr:Breast cancer type 2 susceptibility protein [Zancudomyces culisetae]|eukprot:OMH84186.1 Breast cancer type 2 susceptibility protein [Zancudomyces culisetae]